jgi:lysophospholipid acyltransferase (LPLAT)-like uncharacterized protein
MKLSNPTAIKCVSLLASWIIRLWLGTLDIRFCVDDPAADPLRMKRRGLYMFWHEVMLLPAYSHAHVGFSILVSTHRDGELIAQVVRMLGGGAIRGSSTRGGVAATLGMMRDRRSRHLAITPDGPQGPRRQVQDGAIYLASRGHMPLVPVGYAAADCWRAPSWDRMVLPRPGRRAVCVIGRPIEVPANVDREELDRFRHQAQAAMEEVQGRAERLAEQRTIDASLRTLEQVKCLHGV